MLITFIHQGNSSKAAREARRAKPSQNACTRTRRITVSGAGETIDSTLIQVGDILKVTPGARLPTDGVVLFGSGYVDESLVTGESKPVSKQAGDEVIGGSVNRGGVLFIRASRVGSDTALSKTVSLVQDARMAKAPIQAYPLSSRSQSRHGSAGIYSDASMHTRRNGDALELGHKMRALVFDKTGTDTQGKHQVVDVMCFGYMYELNEMLVLAGSAESGSAHPLSTAIVNYVQETTEGIAPFGDGSSGGGGGGILPDTVHNEVRHRKWLRATDAFEECESMDV